jgi:hypothetical protein
MELFKEVYASGAGKPEPVGMKADEVQVKA